CPSRCAPVLTSILQPCGCCSPMLGRGRRSLVPSACSLPVVAPPANHHESHLEPLQRRKNTLPAGSAHHPAGTSSHYFRLGSMVGVSGLDRYRSAGLHRLHPDSSR